MADKLLNILTVYEKSIQTLVKYNKEETLQ